MREGMQPVAWSKNENLMYGSEWVRAGSEIKFTKTLHFASCLNDDADGYYTLSFTYEYTEAHDVVYFAYSYPYSYTRLRGLIYRISSYKQMVKVEELTRTLGGNVCYYLIVTDDVEKSYHEKRAIILTGRVHPGETSSSYCIEGLLEFLVSTEKEAVLLRKFFVFYIIPMLNPDGVRHGNYRCSLLGVDLNRRWAKPSRSFHPTVYYAQKLVVLIAEDLEIAVYCDFHGHSNKKNIFMYGCHSLSKEESAVKDNLVSMIIPTLLSLMTPSFSLSDTHYKIEKSKETTARIALYREMKITNSYTLEASLLGDTHSIKQFAIGDYKNIGKLFSIALLGITRKYIAKSIEMVNSVNIRRNLRAKSSLGQSNLQSVLK